MGDLAGLGFFSPLSLSVTFSSSVFTLALLMRLIGKRWTTAQKLAFMALELAQNQATDVA